ncbi:MAG: OsmC family protein [Anaerolineaceae bacterium]|nr:OsmC family protein [Anaerolineaceae bacterium]
MDATVSWKERMSFSGKSDSGFTIPLGTSAQVGGDDDGARPMELFLIGLGGCTGMDVISILSKKKQEVTYFDVKIHADRANEHPKVFTAIEVEYIVGGKNIDRVAVERAVQLSAEKYCPAQAMLSKIATLTMRITILEE